MFTYKKLLLSIFFLSMVSFVNSVSARPDDGLALSITPPLIKNNVNPGQIWKSSVKLINNNSYEIKAYVQVSDFEGGPEEGTVKFISADPNSKDNTYLMSRWIVIDPGPITIPAFSSKEISYVVDVPEDAAPGGHYAAILAGTKSTDDQGGGSRIGISTMLSSLILLNVKGDVDERGMIREFSVNKQIVQDANIDFSVRFENIGNVHIQPQGEIKVYDFWDQEKGKILINHNRETGNVLPGGIRKWDFNWTGEKGLFQMGRYKAVLVLSYGQQGRETVDRTLYFWVINFKVLAYVFGSIAFLVLLIVFVVRRSIKKAIMNTQGIVQDSAPVKKTAGKISKEQYEEVQKKGNKMIVITFIVFIIFIAGVFFVNDMMKKESDQTGQQKNPDTVLQNNDLDDANVKDDQGIMVVDIDEILKTSATSSPVSDDSLTEDNVDKSDEPVTEEPEKKENLSNKEQTVNKNIAIRVLNGSGTAGIAGKAADLLKENGFEKINTGNASDFNYNITIIKHTKEKTAEAEFIANLFSNIVKLEMVDRQADDVVVIVGKDFSAAFDSDDKQDGSAEN